MSDLPVNTVPPVKPRRKAGVGMRVLPLVPIVVALVTALVVRQFNKPAAPKPSNEMIGMKAPDFTLRDAHKEEGEAGVTLSLMVEKGPVLMVFFRGYFCERCVGHLRAIGDEMEAFNEAGVQVIAISPDTSANMRDSIEIYGDLPFPLLSDPEDKLAEAYGLVVGDEVYHGVFLVDRNRRIQFAAKTEEPYSDIMNLLEVGKKLNK